MTAFSMGKLNKSQRTTTTDVDQMYNLLISPFCYRYKGCHPKSVCISYCHISRQAIASIIHRGTHILHYGVSRNISDQCSEQGNDHRKCHIMPDKFTLCIAGCAQCSDHTCFLSNRIADCNSKDKSHNYYDNIKKHDHHSFVTSHIFPGKVDCLILIKIQTLWNGRIVKENYWMKNNFTDCNCNTGRNCGTGKGRRNCPG